MDYREGWWKDVVWVRPRTHYILVLIILLFY